VNFHVGEFPSASTIFPGRRCSESLCSELRVVLMIAADGTARVEANIKGVVRCYCELVNRRYSSGEQARIGSALLFEGQRGKGR